jgi:hypothetical protein
MRPIRFLIITILSFVTILNEAFFKRLISLLLCGILGFNSTACYGFWQTSTSPAQASQPLESPPPTQPNPTIAQIPRVRQQNQESSNASSPTPANSGMPTRFNSVESSSKDVIVAKGDVLILSPYSFEKFPGLGKHDLKDGVTNNLKAKLGEEKGIRTGYRQGLQPNCIR